MTWRAAIAAACASMTAAAAWPSASARRPARLPVSGDPGQLADQASCGGERHRRGRPCGHLPQPRRHALPSDAELVIAGREPVMTLTAAIPGPADGHRAEHRVHALGPAAGQIRLVTRPHATRAPAYPGSAARQGFQHASAQPDQPGPDRLLGSLQALPGRHRTAAAAASRVTSAAASAASAAASPGRAAPFLPLAGQGPWRQAPLTAAARRRSPRSPPRSDRQRPEPQPLPASRSRLIQLRARPRMRGHRLAPAHRTQFHCGP